VKSVDFKAIIYWLLRLYFGFTQCQFIDIVRPSESFDVGF